MQIHELRPAHTLKRKKRVGRGGKRGTYSGRGIKGQKSRAGAKIKPMEREFILRLPKRRGLGFPLPRRTRPKIAVSLLRIAARFPDGATISPQTLAEQGLIARRGGRLPEVKLIGDTPIKKKFTVKGCSLSEGARRAVETAGGTIHE
jgi:large subunit ribosomal protein L15